MDKVFAPEFKRNEQGWILFPRDVDERRQMFFPEEVMAHPAKMNFHLQQSIIEYVAKEGDVLLDPFGGTGTLMIGALQNMQVILLEIEDGYHQLQMQAVENLRKGDEEAANRILLLQGDNRILLPIPCNHIITSPPYAQAMNIKKVREVKEGRDDYFAKMDAQMLAYSKSMRNISKLNTFLYNQAMERVYKLCYESLEIGGSMTIIIKDRINNGKRTYLSKWVDRVCKQIGFSKSEWYKWLAPGTSFTNVRRSRGEEVVDEEDIMIYWKD